MSSWRRIQGVLLTGRDLGPAPGEGGFSGRGSPVVGLLLGGVPGPQTHWAINVPPFHTPRPTRPSWATRPRAPLSRLCPPRPAETSPDRGGAAVAPAVTVSVGVRRHAEPGAAGTHKSRGESWAWGPGGTRWPWRACGSRGSCQAVLPRSADGARVSLAALCRWRMLSPSVPSVAKPQATQHSGCPGVILPMFYSEKSEPSRGCANPMAPLC